MSAPDDLAARVAQLEAEVAELRAGFIQPEDYAVRFSTVIESQLQEEDARFTAHFEGLTERLRGLIADLGAQMNLAAVEAASLGIQREIERFTPVVDRALNLAEGLGAEVQRLRSELAAVAGKQASAAELLILYEQRKKERPNLTLRRFLDELGASRRYRTVITERNRRRRKNGGSGHQENEKGEEEAEG